MQAIVKKARISALLTTVRRIEMGTGRRPSITGSNPFKTHNARANLRAESGARLARGRASPGWVGGQQGA